MGRKEYTGNMKADCDQLISPVVWYLRKMNNIYFNDYSRLTDTQSWREKKIFLSTLTFWGHRFGGIKCVNYNNFVKKMVKFVKFGKLW